MHIPSCETAELCLPDFETALKDALLPNDRYDVRRWLYVPNQYTEYRYILGTRGYLSDCVRDMVELGRKRGAEWFCAGRRSKAGHPHHPLYLRKDSALEAFDVDGYISGR